MNLGQIIDNAVLRHGTRIALDDGARRTTFSELGARIYRLGSALARAGIRPRENIASLQYNGTETVEFDLAAARFGYVRTLMNARGDAVEHLRVLQASGARALVFGAQFADEITGLRDSLPNVVLYVCVGGGPSWAIPYEALLADAPAALPAVEVEESDLHSIYFTSGTTGEPKGIVLSQRNWLAVVRNHLIDTYATTGVDDVLLHAAPLSHATGSLVMAHLARGARQRILARFDAGEVLEVFERDRVTNVWLAPTMLIRLLEHEDSRRRDLSSLRSVRWGGGPMPAERVREGVSRWGPVFVGGWGQWEAPQQCTHLSQRHIAEAYARGDLARMACAGLPMTYCGVAVADDDDRILPVGEEGEVVVAGDHLMVGYLGQPEETARLRFGRWQRTGDIGHVDAEGFLYITDRKRDMIISGGTNIYPRDIEEALHAHPDVLECAAIGVPDAQWGERVHALVVPRAGRTPDVEALIAWCRDRLAGYKRPRTLDIVSDLPKNAYGKILRREVRERYWKGLERRV